MHSHAHSRAQVRKAVLRALTLIAQRGLALRAGETVMGDTKRLNTTIELRLFERLERETDGRTPRLPRRYVVELALQRLFEAVDRGQLELGLVGNGRKKS